MQACFGKMSLKVKKNHVSIRVTICELKSFWFLSQTTIKYQESGHNSLKLLFRQLSFCDQFPLYPSISIAYSYSGEGERTLIESFHQMIAHRRSVRKFKPGHVDSNILKRLLDAGRLGPSATNRQALILMLWTILQLPQKFLKPINSQPIWAVPANPDQVRSPRTNRMKYS